MRGKHQGIVRAALLRCTVVLLAATFSPFAHAQTSAPQARERRPSPPRASSPRDRARPGDSRPRDSQTRRAGEQVPRAGEADTQADLSITAHVTADSLRFEKVPNPRVEFTGQPKRNTVWAAERENLPEQVQPGVTYRNIGITLRITSVFADIDRIVAEALGEVPPGDEAQPVTAPPPQQPGTAPPLQQPGTDNPGAVSTPGTDATQTVAPPRATSTPAAAQATADARAEPPRRLKHKGRVN